MTLANSENAPMKIEIIGAGHVDCACAMAAVLRGSAQEIVLVNRTRKTAEAVATDIRYGIPLGPKVDIVDGDYDALKGAGIDERAVIPIGSFQKAFGISLSLPSVVGRSGVLKILEPDLSDEERQQLEKSANSIRNALDRMRKE